MVTETYKLINAIKKMYPVVQFFKNRYFPDGKVYYSEKALIETKRKGREVAPFVIPVVGGIALKSEGYRAMEIEAPYIAPKKVITAAELEKKAFGESPESGRTPAQRENELEAEYMDDLRKSVLRRHELMCTELLLTGKVLMKHYANGDDAVKGVNYDLKYLQFYDNEFTNKHTFTTDFLNAAASKKIEELYGMASKLRKRGIRATDIVLASDVSAKLMSDEKFLKFYDIARVDFGDIKQSELPEGVVCNGRININGVVMTMFTYDEVYEDLDGQEKAFIPAGTVMLLQPGLGETVYAQVTFFSGGSFKSYAEKIVPRFVGSEKENAAEVQVFSRPVPYPYDWESWLVANVNDKPATNAGDGGGQDEDEGVPESQSEKPALKSSDEINAMTKKADLIEYAESIGLDSLSTEQSLNDLKAAILNYQEENYGI
ncbi:MAG: major capsid protein [Lachnospiraceae bacterium]